MKGSKTIKLILIISGWQGCDFNLLFYTFLYFVNVLQETCITFRTL